MATSIFGAISNYNVNDVMDPIDLSNQPILDQNIEPVPTFSRQTPFAKPRQLEKTRVEVIKEQSTNNDIQRFESHAVQLNHCDNVTINIYKD